MLTFIYNNNLTLRSWGNLQILSFFLAVTRHTAAECLLLHLEWMI